MTVEGGEQHVHSECADHVLARKSRRDGHASLCGELMLLGDELTCQAVRPLIGIPIVRAASDIR